MSSSADRSNVGYSDRPGTDGDPTGTHPVSDRYGERLRAEWDAINGDLRRYIEQSDRFGFADESVTDEAAITALTAWLLARVNSGPLSVIGPERNPFVQAAYERGVRNALRELRAAPGFDLNEVADDVPEARRVADGGQPRTVAQNTVRARRGDTPGNATVPHRSRLSELKRRSYRKLRRIGAAVVNAVRSRLTTRSNEQQASGGLTNRRKIANTATGRVNKVGKYRSTLLARSETIRAHSEGALTTAERTSIRAVTVRAEWITAGDRRVCPICRALEGTKYRTANVRAGTFKYEAGPDEAPSLTGVYPIMPPCHVQCRCCLIPSIPVTASQPAPYGTA